jgi:hypothetical protein
MGNAFIIGKPHSYGDGKFSFSHCADIIDMSSNTIKTTRLYNDSRSNDVGYIAELIYNGKLFSVELMPRIDKDDERLSLINPMYLTTINNLETPVVKTSDKTMKITYTITQTE